MRGSLSLGLNLVATSSSPLPSAPLLPSLPMPPPPQMETSLAVPIILACLPLPFGPVSTWKFLLRFLNAPECSQKHNIH